MSTLQTLAAIYTDCRLQLLFTCHTPAQTLAAIYGCHAGLDSSHIHIHSISYEGEWTYDRFTPDCSHSSCYLHRTVDQTFDRFTPLPRLQTFTRRVDCGCYLHPTILQLLFTPDCRLDSRRLHPGQTLDVYTLTGLKIFTLDQTLDGLLRELVGYFCNRVVGNIVISLAIRIRIRYCALKKSAANMLDNCFRW